MPNKYISIRKINLNREMRPLLKQELSERLRSPSTQVLDFKNGDHPMFVVLTPELLSLIVNIYKDNATLVELQTHDLPGIARQWYLTKLLVDEIKLTNDMENVHSTRKEVQDAVESVERSDSPKDIRFFGMASKYSSLGMRRLDELKTCGDVRRLYDEFVNAEVVSENPGDEVDGQIFRANPVYVQDIHQKVIHEGISPEAAIIDSMEKALSILNDTSIERLVRVAVFHYLFGYIHPFYNGNGRLSRYISSMILSDELSPLAGLRLSYVIKDHKRQYDNLFKEANDRRSMGDLTDFVTSFCRYVSMSLQDMIETLRSGKQALENVVRIIHSTPAFQGRERVIEILAMNGIFADNALSIQELQTHSECGRAACQKAIDIAKDMNVLTQTKDGHKYRYTIQPEVWLDMIESAKESR